MPKYRRMTWTDRLVIEKLYNQGRTFQQVAKDTGFAPSSVHREVTRALYPHLGAELTKRPMRYSAQIGQDIADNLATAKGPNIKLGKNYDYASHVAAQILDGMSPDLIVGDLKKENKWTVSTTTLYRYIDRGYIPGVTNTGLYAKTDEKRPYNHVRKAARPPKGQSIEKRPDLPRTVPGHWEMDTVIGKSKGKKQSLLVLTERSSRYELIAKLPDRTTRSVVRAMDRLIPQFPQGTFQTITVDNGSEFQDCHRMEHDKSGSKRTTLYYCHPYSSFERGSNENANRLIRRFFPKGKSLAKVTQAQCNHVADWMNNRPRKILGYDTPAERFQRFLQSLQ